MKIKDYQESVMVEFDFSSELDLVDTASVSVSIYGLGADAGVSSFIYGAPQISGASVYQRIQGGLPGMRYLIACLGTHGSDIIKRKDVIQVE